MHPAGRHRGADQQALGGNVTVRLDRGLYRIECEHTEAIGGYAAENAEEGAIPEFTKQAVWAALKTCLIRKSRQHRRSRVGYDLSIAPTPSGGRRSSQMTLTAPVAAWGR